VTEFQQYCKKHRLDLLEKETFEKFKEFYPNLKERDAKKEFEAQITQLFFLGR